MTVFQMTVRYGERYQRYHTCEVEGRDLSAALSAAAEAIPDRILPHADLVEIRPKIDPDERTYVGEGAPGAPEAEAEADDVER